MSTYFAPPERTSPKELELQFDLISSNRVISQVLQGVGGLLAILDENRHIVALNDTFLQMLNIEDSEAALGLRLGEAIHCIHAGEGSQGCGTSKYCSTCGAAIATVAALVQGVPVERTCSISTNENGERGDLFFSVQASPIQLSSRQFVFLFLQDITADQQRAALERTFFHDVSNTLQMLVGASELLVSQQNSSLAKTIHKASLRLQDEIYIQRCLSQKHISIYQPTWEMISTTEILTDLEDFFAIHPLTQNKNIIFPIRTSEGVAFPTDLSLLWRILHNMLLNALEATIEDEDVKIWFIADENYLTFKVWNGGMIAKEVAHRIFQRNFSTKGDTGRGLGTYSMKYFGEKILGGKVWFTSTDEEGTTFCYRTQLSRAGYPKK